MIYGLEAQLMGRTPPRKDPPPGTGPAASPCTRTLLL